MAIHNIKVIVVDGGKRSYGSTRICNKDEKNNYKDSPLYKVLNARQTIKNKVQSGMSPAAVFAMNMGLRVTGQIVRQSANYFISDIGRKNGDSSLQGHIDREIEIVTDATGVIGSTLSGAATGSMFGPVGATIGAVTGLASSAISLAFRQVERERAFNYKEFKENNSIEYQRARASINLTTGRLR